MIKLRIILQSKLFIITFIIISIILIFLGYYKDVSISSDKVIGRIQNITINKNKVSFQVNQYLINYYALSLDEIDKIKEYKLGDIIEVEGNVTIPNNNTNFNLFNYRLYLKSKKIYYLLKTDNIKLISKNNNIFYKIKNIIIDKINNSKNSEYLKAFILGDTKSINDSVTDSFRINGISHLFAISGMHVSLLSSILLFILNKIKDTNFNYLIVIILLFIYSFFANNSPSIMRSCFLFSFLFINKLFKLNLKTYIIFIIITCLFLIYNPYYIYNVGFLFSFTISFFLIIFGSITNNYNNYFIKLLLTSIIAFLASIPISINNFYSLNLLSPFINIVFVPLISFIIFPLTLLSFIISPLSFILNLFIELLEFLSIFFSKYSLTITLCHISIYIVIIYYIFIIFILYNFKKRKYYYLIIIYIILFIHTNFINLNDEIHIIDVGQGDSILIKLKYNKGNILIDTGGIPNYTKEEWKRREYSLAKNILIPYLNSLGINKLDYLVITHGDFDHLGEAIYLINNIKINNVLLNSSKNNKSELDIIELLNKKNITYKNINKYSININNNKLDFINDKGSTENEDSLVLHTFLNNKNILLMGDAGIESEKRIINEYNLGKMDILKVGHHGSKNSSSREFLNTINPSYAFISVGINNKFNHPNKTTLDKLDELSIPYYLTSISGSIKIILSDKIQIYTCT